MFTQRASHPEILDQPDADAALVRRGYSFMALINRHFGGTRVVRQFVAAQALQQEGPLHVLDIGAGGGDIAIDVSRWARQRGLDVRFTCLDYHPVAAEVCRANLAAAGDPAIELVQQDIFHHHPKQPYDCAVSSMFFHHLSEQSILLLIERLRTLVRRSVLINDLRRAAAHYYGCVLVSPALPYEVRHDALLSIRRGFRVHEIHDLLGRVEHAMVRVRRRWFFRIEAVVEFEQPIPLAGGLAAGPATG